EMPLDQAYAFASEVMVKNMMTADACEGIGAFLDKRQPDWKDS
ncbi:MAG TPA: enoyl-CoA hydratase, partial [Hyphomicrobium sp.]|nr:enoyl-CoA hydratase [Hyphomicrobium sp.]